MLWRRAMLGIAWFGAMPRTIASHSRPPLPVEVRTPADVRQQRQDIVVASRPCAADDGECCVLTLAPLPATPGVQAAAGTDDEWAGGHPRGANAGAAAAAAGARGFAATRVRSLSPAAAAAAIPSLRPAVHGPASAPLASPPPPPGPTRPPHPPHISRVSAWR